MPRNGPITLDANIILRHLVRDEPALTANADAIVATAQRGEQDLLCDPVTLAEIVYVLKGVYHWPAPKITLALMKVLALEHVRMPDKSRYQLALKLMLGPAPHFGDACCSAAAIYDCCGLLYSFDRDLSRVPEVDRREEPVA